MDKIQFTFFCVLFVMCVLGLGWVADKGIELQEQRIYERYQ